MVATNKGMRGIAAEVVITSESVGIIAKYGYTRKNTEKQGENKHENGSQ